MLLTENPNGRYLLAAWDSFDHGLLRFLSALPGG